MPKEKDVAGGRSSRLVLAVPQHSDPTRHAMVPPIASNGYHLPPTNLTHDEGPDGYDILTASLVEAVGAFHVFPDYMEQFTIACQVSRDGGATWLAAGRSTNPLYVTWKCPTTTLYRTVLHIGSTNAVEKVFEQDIIDAIWSEFADLTVTRWNGGEPLKYDHVEEEALDNPLIPNIDPITGTILDSLLPSNTAELLRFGHGQCTAWTDFFIATLRAQGIQAGSEKDIVPKEGDGFLTYPPEFQTPGYFPEAPLGYRTWQVAENVLMGIPDVQGKGAPQRLLTFHRVVVIHGEIFDPSYGAWFSTLFYWNDAMVAGVYVEVSGNHYLKRRQAGEMFVEFR